MPTLLTVKELMDYFNCSRTSLNTMRKIPGFPAPVTGVVGLKWREQDIVAWVASS